jgi:histidinol phosphatase-like enzyme (inositol monophosphatase family)
VSPELEAALAAARAAGRLQRRRFRKPNAVELKADDTPVTAADRDSELLIRRMLAGVVPGAGFLAEEGEAVESETGIRWIIDPLDGTKKFVRGLPFFGPCIALERDDEIVLGVMHLPAMGETYWSERGQGAFCNGEPIRVSAQTDLDRAYVVHGSESQFYRRGWSETLKELILGTYHNPGFLDLYSYASLACGRVDAVIDVGDSPWDIAAAQVIFDEAGGRMTDFRGGSAVYAETTLATNGEIHAQLLAVLSTCR